MLFTTILYIVDGTLIQLNKKYIQDEKKEKQITRKNRLWEEISNIILIIIFGMIWICLAIKFNAVSLILNIVYYGGCIALYTSILINVLMKEKAETITSMELQVLTLIPLLVTSLYNLLEKSIINYEIFSNCIMEVFIFKNIVKYFVIIFFISMDIFILFKELQQYMEHKNKKIKAKNSDYELFEILSYEYNNSKGKKGIRFIGGYIKDISIAICKLINSLLYIYIGNVIRFIFIVLKKLVKKITQNFSMYVIIVKTFNISLIISLLITYYKLLIDYNNNTKLELYSVIITAIIIPSVLEIIGDLKNK